jgi:hypothetical protein
VFGDHHLRRKLTLPARSARDNDRDSFNHFLRYQIDQPAPTCTMSSPSGPYKKIQNVLSPQQTRYVKVGSELLQQLQELYPEAHRNQYDFSVQVRIAFIYGSARKADPHATCSNTAYQRSMDV